MDIHTRSYNEKLEAVFPSSTSTRYQYLLLCVVVIVLAYVMTQYYATMPEFRSHTS